MDNARAPLSSIFGQFVGKPITIKYQSTIINAGSQQMREKFLTLADNNDPLLRAMEQVARSNGLSLRLLLPDQMSSAEFNPSRVNVPVEEVKKGVFRIGSDFTLG